MTSVALHSLGQARDILDEWLEEAAGEAIPEIETLMAELDLKVDEKIVNVALYIREQLATATVIEEEIKRLAARQNARLAAASRLKTYLQAWMERLGKTKVTDPRCTVAVQLNNPSVVGEISTDKLAELHCRGEDEATFVTYKPASYALNRMAVAAAHKEGRWIPDGLSVVRTSSLRIR